MQWQRRSWLHGVALGMLIVVGFLPWVVGAGTVTPTNVTGSANHVGDPEGTDRAQVRFVGKFSSAALGAVAAVPPGLAACTVKLIDCLFEVDPDDPGELVLNCSGKKLIPRSGSGASAAIFELAGRPSFRMEVKTRGGNLFEFNLKIDRATIPEAPEVVECPVHPPEVPIAVCTEFSLRTTFAIQCPTGLQPGGEVVTTDLNWRQDPHDPFSFRYP